MRPVVAGTSRLSLGPRGTNVALGTAKSPRRRSPRSIAMTPRRSARSTGEYVTNLPEIPEILPTEILPRSLVYFLFLFSLILIVLL